MSEPVTCAHCGHTLCVIRDDGWVEVKHRKIRVVAPYCNVTCPECETCKPDIGMEIAAAIAHALQYCR